MPCFQQKLRITVCLQSRIFDDKVVVRMRTAKDDVDHVYYIEGKKRDSYDEKSCSQILCLIIMSTQMTAGEEQILYHFKIVKGYRSLSV